MLASQWVWQRTKSVRIPAEEQNAGRVVDYFYRMEFHITPRFFSDSNYLFFLKCQFLSTPNFLLELHQNIVFFLFVLFVSKKQRELLLQRILFLLGDIFSTKPTSGRKSVERQLKKRDFF